MPVGAYSKQWVTNTYYGNNLAGTRFNKFIRSVSGCRNKHSLAYCNTMVLSTFSSKSASMATVAWAILHWLRSFNKVCVRVESCTEQHSWRWTGTLLGHVINARCVRLGTKIHQQPAPLTFYPSLVDSNSGTLIVRIKLWLMDKANPGIFSQTWQRRFV